MTGSSKFDRVSLVSGEVLPFVNTTLNTPLLATPTLLLHRNMHRIGCSSREYFLEWFHGIFYYSVLGSSQNDTSHSETPPSDRNTVNSTTSVEMDQLRVKGFINSTILVVRYLLAPINKKFEPLSVHQAHVGF